MNTLPVPPDAMFTRASTVVDSDHPAVKLKSDELVKGKNNAVDRAVALFYFVRDAIPYNLFVKRDAIEDFKASSTLERKEGYCVQKAVLLAALARASGIPAGFGFARIQNHLLPEKALLKLGTNILPFHGYTELFLDGKWVRVTAAWDVSMSDRPNSYRVEFDGKSDSMLPHYNRAGKLHVEYLADLGHYEEVPLDVLWQTLKSTYGAINLTR
jgi:transglutaminase-like putative cysteine protease